MKRREFIAGLGGAAVWPLLRPRVARAQQATMPVIGYLAAAASSPVSLAAFHRGLAERGYVEGRNIRIVYRAAEGKYDRLPALAAELVRQKVAVLVATGSTPTALAAKSATQTIPIVFLMGTNPVEYGLVSSLARPGGNITGVTNLTAEVNAKRLDLLHELVPMASTIALIANPLNLAETREEKRAADAIGVRLSVLPASTLKEVEEAFATLVAQRVGAVQVTGDPIFFTWRVQLAAMAVRYRVPAIYVHREIVEAGGLMSYATDIVEGYRTVGDYTARILKGEKPADLPVQQATKSELVINLRTAKALGLTIPPNLLALADEVIE
jgi:putative tryptophan/tyrosine transport system substrate-binding protein